MEKETFCQCGKKLTEDDARHNHPTMCCSCSDKSKISSGTNTDLNENDRQIRNDYLKR